MIYQSPELKKKAEREELGRIADAHMKAKGIKPPTLEQALVGNLGGNQSPVDYLPPRTANDPGEPPPGHPAARSHSDDGYTGGVPDPVPPAEEIDHHRNAPKPSPDCLYGLVGDIAKAGSQNTEANPYAIAATALAYLGVAIGRGPYQSLGDGWQHTNLFFIHVGRSAQARKGTAKRLVLKIADRVHEINKHLAPQKHTGGLSSKEGLVNLIHDGYNEGTEKEVPPIADKRLFVYESELANTLHQAARSGNTLSAAVRDLFDSWSIKPATKSASVGVEHPHVGIIADITQIEMLDMMTKRELSNGFANRFVIFWSESGVINPFPEPTPPDVISSLAHSVCDVLNFAGAYRHIDRNTDQMEMTAEARDLYAKWYRKSRVNRALGEKVSGLLDRGAVVLRRLSMIFALTDQTMLIEVHHIKPAIAWIDYWRESVKFIFQTAAAEHEAEVTQDTAQKIVAYLTANGKKTRTDITRECFGGNSSKTMIDTALEELLTATPPAIEVETAKKEKGTKGKAAKFYRCLKWTQVSRQFFS